MDTNISSSVMRISVVDTEFPSISTPSTEREQRIAATAVVPLPVKGSRTKSPSLEEARRMRSRSARGFWAGCLPKRFSALWAA